MQLILFSKKRSHEEFVKVVLREKNCWKKKSLMDRKMEKQLNKKNNFKKQKQKVDAHCAKFLIDDDHLSIKNMA